MKLIATNHDFGVTNEWAGLCEAISFLDRMGVTDSSKLRVIRVLMANPGRSVRAGGWSIELEA